MAYYYSIPIEEMEEELESLRFYPVNLVFRNRPVKEWVYERKLPRSPNHFVRVYTGINRYGQSAGESRKSGKDAIRIQVIYRDAKGETLVSQTKRVHRVGGWRKNLHKRMNEVSSELPQVEFDSRGEPMTLRKKGKNQFWGSRDYPKFKETKPFRAEGGNQVIRFNTLEEFHKYALTHKYSDADKFHMRAESREEFQQFSQTQPVIILDFDCYATRKIRSNAIGIAYNHVVPLSNVSFQNLGANFLPIDLIKEYGAPQSAHYELDQDYSKHQIISMSHNYGNKKEQTMLINLKGLPLTINWSWSWPDEFGRMELWLWDIPLNSIENKDELNFKNVVKLNPIKGHMWNKHQSREECRIRNIPFLFASEGIRCCKECDKTTGLTTIQAGTYCYDCLPINLGAESDNQVIRFNGEMSEYADKDTDDSFTSMSNLAHISLPNYEESYYWTSADGNSRATVAYDEENEVILIPNFEVSLHMRGKKMAHKYLEELIDDAYQDGYPVQVIDVDNHAIGFWEKMQSQGLIEGWSKGSFAAESPDWDDIDWETDEPPKKEGWEEEIDWDAESYLERDKRLWLNGPWSWKGENPSKEIQHHYKQKKQVKSKVRRFDSANEFGEWNRNHLRVGRDEYVIVFNFDYYVKRTMKNPIATVYNRIIPLGNIASGYSDNFRERNNHLIKRYGAPLYASALWMPKNDGTGTKTPTIKPTKKGMMQEFGMDNWDEDLIVRNVGTTSWIGIHTPSSQLKKGKRDGSYNPKRDVKGETALLINIKGLKVTDVSGGAQAIKIWGGIPLSSIEGHWGAEPRFVPLRGEQHWIEQFDAEERGLKEFDDTTADDFVKDSDDQITLMLRNKSKINKYGDIGCPSCGSIGLFSGEIIAKGKKWYCFDCLYEDKTETIKSRGDITLEKYGLLIECPLCEKQIKAYNQDSMNRHMKKCGEKE